MKENRKHLPDFSALCILRRLTEKCLPVSTELYHQGDATNNPSEAWLT